MNKTKKQSDKFAFLIVLLITAGFSIFVEDVGANFIDYHQIWSCVKDDEFLSGDPSGCGRYPPLLVWFGKVFSAREIMFKEFLLLLNFIVIPLLIYRITNNPITVWFYFSATNYAIVVLTSSFFAQALAMGLIVSMVWMNDRQRVVTLFLSIIAHSYSFYFAIGFFVLLKLEEYYKEHGFRLPYFLSCSPIWGNNTPELLTTRLMDNPQLSSGYVTMNTIGSIFLKRTPFIFLLPALKSLWDRKAIALLGFMAISFIAGFVVHERAFYFMAFPMIIGLTWFYEETAWARKYLLWASLFFFVFNIYQFVTVVECMR